MNLYESSISLIEDFLENHDTVPKVIDKIKSQTGDGKVAFFPCSRYANMVVREIKEKHPELFSQVEGFYDKSREAKSDTGISVRHISEIKNRSEDISLVVICSNTYHEREAAFLKQETGFTGKLLRTSYFDISLPEQGKDNILEDIKTVYGMFSDEKSKAVYMITWLSKALNDETYTWLFESETNIEIDGRLTRYKNYQIKDLGDVCAAELFSEIYSMKYVYPAKGDQLLDIGGYKGDTAIYFADAVGKNGKVFVFEPTASNFNILTDNINSNDLGHIISPVNKGVSDVCGSMKATSVDSGAPWSFISEDKGNEEVVVTTIDDFVADEGLDKVNFIKMDVEGLEEKVIAGGRETIRKMKPKLAIPLYHKFSDLTAIPLQVKEYCPQYKFYIRSKMEGPFGVTMYCI